MTKNLLDILWHERLTRVGIIQLLMGWLRQLNILCCRQWWCNRHTRAWRSRSQYVTQVIGKRNCRKINLVHYSCNVFGLTARSQKYCVKTVDGFYGHYHRHYSFLLSLSWLFLLLLVQLVLDARLHFTERVLDSRWLCDLTLNFSSTSSSS